MKQFISFLAVVFICFSCTTNNKKLDNVKVTKQGVVKLTNGNWFDGYKFISKTAWIIEGKLTFKGDALQTNEVIDLKNKFIIPPFAEAHNHNLESDYKLDNRIDSYLQNGVFYVKHLSSIKKRVMPLMHNYNKPTGIDVSFAHAPLTASGGHPIALRKKFLEMGRFDDMFKTLEDIESHGYFVINNNEDLNNKWAQILSFKPDFIKIMLLYSEEYNLRKNEKKYFGQKGLDPKIVPDIVKKAHKEGLRVSAHVETAYDFKVAVDAGVDEIAHLPEIDNGQPIPIEYIRLAKNKETIITTTVSLIKKRKDNPNYEELLKNIKSNLRLLKENNIKLAIGSDMYNDNSYGEFELLKSFEIFSNLELLKMWCENSAYTTFPNRKIGLLKEGYEASFLVLDKNPLIDLKNLSKSISLRVKQGQILD